MPPCEPLTATAPAASVPKSFRTLDLHSWCRSASDLKLRRNHSRNKKGLFFEKTWQLQAQLFADPHPLISTSSPIFLACTACMLLVSSGLIRRSSAFGRRSLLLSKYCLIDNNVLREVTG